MRFLPMIALLACSSKPTPAGEWTGLLSCEDLEFDFDLSVSLRNQGEDSYGGPFTMNTEVANTQGQILKTEFTYAVQVTAEGNEPQDLELMATFHTADCEVFQDEASVTEGCTRLGILEADLIDRAEHLEGATWDGIHAIAIATEFCSGSLDRETE